MRTMIFGAGSDLGVHIDGASLGPKQLMNDISTFYKGESMLFQQDANIIKSRNFGDRRKNEYEVEKFNTELYKNIVSKIKEEYFPILIGGDHSVAIASALASCKVNIDVGIIWIDAHTDYNTFETTITGNIHGLPLAAITGYKCNELRYYHDGKVIQPSRTVIVGARSIDDAEKDNLRYAGVTVFSTQDIKEKGIDAVMDEAFKIAGYKTKGVHVSYDIDVIDPYTAPGVSIPEYDGISEEEAMKINEYLVKHINEILSFDLVEFNPLRDQDRRTEQIALNILTQIINAAEKKKKWEQKTYY
ncbi:MAG: arginase [Bacilli bacterium]|nr:arginase [Bacilli bacterium]MBR6137216.1 arginase [Bacilli bacterium]